jgi:hypothetical protein
MVRQCVDKYGDKIIKQAFQKAFSNPKLDSLMFELLTVGYVNHQHI